LRLMGYSSMMPSAATPVTTTSLIWLAAVSLVIAMSMICLMLPFDLTFKDVVKNIIKQPNQCMTYQNINSLAIDLPTFT